MAQLNHKNGLKWPEINCHAIFISLDFAHAWKQINSDIYRYVFSFPSISFMMAMIQSEKNALMGIDSLIFQSTFDLKKRKRKKEEETQTPIANK